MQEVWIVVFRNYGFGIETETKMKVKAVSFTDACEKAKKSFGFRENGDTVLVGASPLNKRRRK